MLLHGLQHVAGGLHINALYAIRRGQVHGASNQRNVGAGLLRCASQGKAHFAAGSVGDATYRVNGFVGRASRNQHLLACQYAGSKLGGHGFVQFPGLKHAAVAHFATGLLAAAHAQHMGAVGSDLRQIALRGGMGIHFAVHGRRNQQRRARRACQAGQADEFICTALCQTRDAVCAARRQQNQVCFAPQADMCHMVGRAFIPLAGKHRSPRKGLHGGGGDEVAGALAHHDLHLRARLDQQAAQLGRFVAGHAASQPQQNAAARQFLQTGGRQEAGGRCSRACVHAVRAFR